jgi:hypothetical protein
MPQKKGHKKAKKGGMTQSKIMGFVPDYLRYGDNRPRPAPIDPRAIATIRNIFDIPQTNKYNLPIVGRQIYGTTGQGFGPAHYTRRAGSGIKIIHRGRGLPDIVSTNPFTTL